MGSKIFCPSSVPIVDDPEVERWTAWLANLIGPEEWRRRRARIVEFRAARAPWPPARLAGTSFVPPDAAAWHLFLCETWLRDQAAYDFAQGARHIPVAKALGRSWDAVQQVQGAEERLRTCFLNTPEQFDSALFELLVGAGYVRSGWKNVRLIQPSPASKRPDLEAEGPPGPIYIECKRRSRISDYAGKEREHWLTMWEPIAEVLRSHRLPFVLDVEFRVPVLRLERAYLMQRLGSLLPLATAGVILDDDQLFVRVRDVDLAGARRELRDVGVRADGSRLHHLLFGDFDPSRGVTAVWEAQRRPGYPIVIDDVEWAAGAIWCCTAQEAIDAKARYLKRELAEAVSQIPSGAQAAFHWGLELYDGEAVAAKVYERTAETLKNFDTRPAILRWVYVHLFEFTVPPAENWAIQETRHFFADPDARQHEMPALLIVPPDAE